MNFPCPIMQFLVRGKPGLPYQNPAALVIVPQGEDGHSAIYGERLRDSWRDWPDQYGLVVLEHDIAVPKETWDELAAEIIEFPRWVIAAWYRLYPVSTGLPMPVWAHRIAMQGQPSEFRCGDFPPLERPASFGLGCTFLPARLLDALPDDLGQWDYPVLDTRLSELARELGVGIRTVPTPVVHLHY
jgi:hypothetical protein